MSDNRQLFDVGWMMGDKERDQEIKRREYLQERYSLISSKSGQVKLFDKTLILIATGALTLSIAFIRDIIPDIKPSTSGLLKVSWACFSISLLFVLLAYLFSKFAYQKAITDLWDFIYKDIKKINYWSILVDFLNVSSVIAIFIGVIYLVLFSARNL